MAPPEANGIKRSQIKWKLLLFDESDLFFDFFVFSLEPCYLFSHKLRNMYFLKPNQIIKWSGHKKNV